MQNLDLIVRYRSNGATFYIVQCCENIVYEKGEVIDFGDCWIQEKPTKQPEATYEGLKSLRAFK